MARHRSSLPVSTAKPPVSRVTVKNRGKVKVTLNGADVSDRAFEADSEEGWVHMYRVSDGHKMLTDNKLEWECVQGDVKVKPFG